MKQNILINERRTARVQMHGMTHYGCLRQTYSCALARQGDVLASCLLSLVGMVAVCYHDAEPNMLVATMDAAEACCVPHDERRVL